MMNLSQLAQMMMSSPNPMQVFAQYASKIPQGIQVIRMMQGKTPEQFRPIVENMAKQQGTTLEQVIANMGLKLNK